MSLEIYTFTLGPLENNTYVAVDTETKMAVVIDPAFDSAEIAEVARQKGWQLSAIWITHAHFDHIAGVEELTKAWGKPIPVGIHPADISLWQSGGGAGYFGVRFNSGPTPTQLFEDNGTLTLGKSQFQVYHIPGHSRGHVVIYSEESQALFCGDVIFQGSVGRTDLPGGDFDELIAGIQKKVMTLPDDTRLLPGHGSESTVGRERETNPFL
jgi:glyoxylase-like metal-dependent hydrolase (beta-lactamase superfamily II)